MAKNILILTPFHFPNLGGAESFIDGLEREAKKWFKITVLTYMPFKGEARRYEESFYKRGSLKVYRMSWLIRLQGAWKGTSLRNMLCTFPKMAFVSWLLCLRNKYEIIHAQGLICGLIAVLLRKIFKVKVFITLLALYNFKEWKGIRRGLAIFIMKGCDVLFVEGNNGLRDIGGLQLMPKITHNFNHWVDQDIFCPPKNRLNDKIRVLFVGRPIKEKGRDIVEGAERLLNNDKYEFHYVQDVSHKDLPKYYQMAHILIVSSRYNEGHSVVVAEAASCGCAVITSDRGSLPEQVKDFGLPLHARSEILAKVIESLDIETIEVMGKTSFVKSRELFSNKNAEVFMTEYTNA